MKNIAIIIISISSIVLLSCVKKDVNGNSVDESKIYTSGSEVVDIDLVEIMKTFDVKPVYPNQLIHTNATEVTFISKKIRAPIEFHHIISSYVLDERQYREDHEQILKLFVRYSADNEYWSSWSENSLVIGEGAGTPEKYIKRSWSASKNLVEQFGGAFKYYQFKLVSSPQNQGKIVFEDLMLLFTRLPSL